MQPDTDPDADVVRRVFPSWSIVIPASFAETFVEDDDYWHAWDRDRSVSLTSAILSDDHGPVDAGRLARELPEPDWIPMDGLPDGLSGWTIEVQAETDTARSRSGLLVADGRVLAATVTGDVSAWVRRTWSSIRFHPAGLPQGPAGPLSGARATLAAWPRATVRPPR